MFTFRRRKTNNFYNGFASQQTFPKPHPVRDYIRTHKKVVIPGALAAVLLLATASAAIYNLTRKEAPAAAPAAVKPAPKPTPPAPKKIYSPLTGQEVSAAEAARPVTGIMIENSPSARPQSGLWDAGIVYEAIAEGGITRLAVLYQEKRPNLVGPVRSLRMYYLDWMSAYNASIVHIGGSREALAKVRNGEHRDLDQFFNAPYFWRATDRRAPHNVYTSFDKLDELNKNKGYTKSEFKGFARRDEKKESSVAAAKINVNISSPLYNSVYAYNATDNCYSRSHQSGGSHNDREQGKPLCPKSVVVMKVHEVTVLEDGYRQAIQTTGSGPVYVFQDGQVKEGQWSKAGPKEPLTLKDGNGVPIELVRGQTWITAIPEAKSVTWTP